MITSIRQGATLERSQVEAQRQSRLLVLALGLLSILGIGLAGYMSYTDLLGSVPVCGGVGDCETVHTSAYAYLATVPVAVFGLLSYMGITALALVRWRAKGTLGYLASLGILVLASSGTLFSAYLTYVEFFVIDAVCPWCVASAVTITVSLALAATDVAAQTRRG